MRNGFDAEVQLVSDLFVDKTEQSNSRTWRSRGDRFSAAVEAGPSEWKYCTTRCGNRGFLKGDCGDFVGLH